MALGAMAQSKINPVGRFELERYNERVQQRIKTLGADAANDSVPEVGVIVKMNTGYGADFLRSKGYDVVTDLGDILVVRCKITQVEALAELSEVQGVSFGGKQRPMMTWARPDAGVSSAHVGINIDGTTHSFDGSGVVLGIMDGGLDPNHINFQGRVERLWHFTGSSGASTQYTSANISSFTTDDVTESHATHVAGIMAGGYKGNVTYINTPDAEANGSSSMTTGPNPFYGVAPGASLAFSVGDGYDDNIIQGIQNIIDYAASQGKPAAVNVSLGSNGGPQDGSDLFSQALERLGEQALICVSAGNEGADNMSLTKTFTASELSFKTMMYYNSSAGATSNDGYLDIWCSDATPLTITIGNVSSTGTITNVTTLSTSQSSSKKLASGVKSGGTVYYTSGIDALSGRYNVFMEFNSAKPTTGRFVITVSGAEGQTATMFFSGYSGFTDSYNNNEDKMSGYTAGSPDNSINAMVCGKNVISVGAYTTATAWRDFSNYNDDANGPWTFGEDTPGEIASFSSYGHDYFGRQLPLITAPGTVIMSSFSTPYVDGGYGDKYYEGPDDMVGRLTSGSKNYYWGPMQGTSMSCPYATGVMGLWLQADPTLTFNDVLHIMEKTSTTDAYTAASPLRFGYGKLNAEAGLRYILGEYSAIGGVEMDPEQRLLLNRTAEGYDVTVAGEASLAVTLHDMQGRCVASTSQAGSTVSVATSHLAPGVYILSVRGANASYTRKITK